MIKITIKTNKINKDILCDEKRTIKSLLEVLSIPIIGKTAYLSVDNRIVDIDNTIDALKIKELEKILY